MGATALGLMDGAEDGADARFELILGIDQASDGGIRNGKLRIRSCESRFAICVDCCGTSRMGFSLGFAGYEHGAKISTDVLFVKSGKSGQWVVDGGQKRWNRKDATGAKEKVFEFVSKWVCEGDRRIVGLRIRGD